MGLESGSGLWAFVAAILFLLLLISGILMVAQAFQSAPLLRSKQITMREDFRNRRVTIIAWALSGMLYLVFFLTTPGIAYDLWKFFQ